VDFSLLLDIVRKSLSDFQSFFLNLFLLSNSEEQVFFLVSVKFILSDKYSFENVENVAG